MNSIERLQKLSGITIVEGASYSPAKKYAGCDKSELEKAKKELTAVVADTANSSFKSQNAKEELKAVNAALAALADADKPKEDVKEGEETPAAIVEAKDEDDKEKKDEDEKDSDKKDDKDSDDKPAFLKKKDDKDSDDDKKEKEKDDDKGDDCKCDESVEEIAAKILAPEVETSIEPIIEASNAFDVFLNGKKIDTVYNTTDDASEVKRGLVDHDGYDSGISVKKAAKKKVAESSAKILATEVESIEESVSEPIEGTITAISDYVRDGIWVSVTYDGAFHKASGLIPYSNLVSGKPVVVETSYTNGMGAEKVGATVTISPEQVEWLITSAKEEGVMESTAEELAAKILEADLTPQEIKVDYQNGPEENSGIKKEEGQKVRVPADVKKHTKQRIAELKSAIERYDDKGYNDKSIKQQAVDCLEQILDNLAAGNVESVKQAQIYFGTLMSPLTDFFPPSLINFLAHALNPNIKESKDNPRYDTQKGLNKRIAEIEAKLADKDVEESYKKILRKRLADYKSGSVTESLDDSPEARQAWKKYYGSGFLQISPETHEFLYKQLGKNLAPIAGMGYAMYTQEEIRQADNSPFGSVDLNPEEVDALQFGMDAAYEDEREAEFYKARKQADYRSQEEIDDPMNEPEEY